MTWKVSDVKYTLHCGVGPQCGPLGRKKRKEIETPIIHGTRYMSLEPYFLAIFQQGVALSYSTSSSPEEERINSTV